MCIFANTLTGNAVCEYRNKMKKKTIEKQYGVSLIEAYITGGADIQPHDWLADCVCPHLEDGSVRFFSFCGAVYSVSWDEETQTGVFALVYKEDGAWDNIGFIERTIRRLCKGEYGVSEYYSAEDVVEYFEDHSVDYVFSLGQRLWVVDIFESKKVLHNNATVRCVMEPENAPDIKEAHEKIISELERGNDQVLAGVSGSLCLAEEKEKDVRFEFWYVE